VQETADLLIPHERAVTLVFWYQQLNSLQKSRPDPTRTAGRPDLSTTLHHP